MSAETTDNPDIASKFRYSSLLRVDCSQLTSCFSSTYDEYGFERPKNFDPAAYESFMSGYLPVLVRRSQRWEQELIGPDQSYVNVVKGRKIKRFVRKGIPSSHRSNVWMIISGAQAMKQECPDDYVKMLSIKVDAHSLTVEQINTDLNRLL